MSTVEHSRITPASYKDLEHYIAAVRHHDRDFGGFAMPVPFDVTLVDRLPVRFVRGDRLTHYGAKALLLATLNSTEYSVCVARDLRVTIADRQVPSTEDLSHPNAFEIWMHRAMQV